MKHSIINQNMGNAQSKHFRRDFFPLGLVVGIILGRIVVIWRKKK